MKIKIEKYCVLGRISLLWDSVFFLLATRVDLWHNHLVKILTI